MKKSLILFPATLLLGSVPALADINISIGSGGLKAVDTDRDIQFKMGGRIQVDYSQIQTEEDGADSEMIVNELELRRARLYAAGEVSDWAFKAQFNIGNDNGGTPEDLYIRYKGWGKSAVVTVGKQKEPFSLEQLESSKDITLLERSSVMEQYAFGRNYGISLAGDWGFGYYALGVFEDDESLDDKLTLNDPAITGRFVVNPLSTDNALIHLGVGYSHRSLQRVARNVELGASLGAFHTQAEYFYAEQDLGETEASDEGFYVQAAYVLTGEHRGYKKGAFKRIKPESDAGAWEVALRYDRGIGKYKDYGLDKGIEGEAVTAGINWYANNNVKVGLNYGYAVTEDAGIDDKGQSLRLRTQLVW